MDDGKDEDIECRGGARIDDENCGTISMVVQEPLLHFNDKRRRGFFGDHQDETPLPSKEARRRGRQDKRSGANKTELAWPYCRYLGEGCGGKTGEKKLPPCSHPTTITPSIKSK